MNHTIKAKLLAIDDDRQHLRLITDALEGEPLEILTAEDA